MPGPMTRAQLLEIWRGATDEAYNTPLISKGEGKGLEVYGQLADMLARASQAVDATTQAMFIRPWSGQSSSPALGEAYATVEIQLTRTGQLGLPLLLLPGEFFVEEETTDVGQDEPAVVRTGRRYTPVSPVVFLPGVSGPLTATFVAERPGVGYNNPRSGTLKAIPQPGAGFQNTRAYLITGESKDVLVCDPHSDTFIPEHRGQYVELTAGANVGAVVRVAGYAGPVPNVSPYNGGSLILDPLMVFEGTLVGAYAEGESVTQLATGATGTVVLASTDLGAPYHRVMVRRVSGVFTTTDTITGNFTFAAFTPTSALNPPVALTAEPPTPDGVVSWKVLDWTVDIGLTAYNAESPSGGRASMLDALGAERKIARSSGESDESYSKRISEVADVVSPNALRRAANRVLTPFGVAGCLREVGLERLQGLFYDAPKEQHGCYGLDCFAVRMSNVFGGNFINDEEVLFVDTTVLPTLSIVARGYYAGFTSPNHFFIRRGLPGNWDRVEEMMGAGTILAVAYRAPAVIKLPTVVAQNGPRVEDRFRYTFSYDEARAYFLMGVPPSDMGDFGFFYDTGAFSAYDSSPYLSFYDGSPVNTAMQYLQVWKNLEKAKAGGVGFDLYVEKVGCDV
jgi:hypothetical protein